MTEGDAKLRDLERRWLTTGSIDDEADFLKERVRVGALDSARLAVAAACGHPAARAALGQPPSLGTEVPLEDLLVEKPSMGPFPWSRIAYAVACLAVAKWQEHVPHDVLLKQALSAIEQGLSRPGPQLREGRDAEATAGRAFQLAHRRTRKQVREDRRRGAGATALPEAAGWPPAVVVEAARTLWNVPESRYHATQAIALARKCAVEEVALGRAVRQILIGWAMG